VIHSYGRYEMFTYMQVQKVTPQEVSMCVCVGGGGGGGGEEKILASEARFP
jgi:hypothetical protein